MTADQGDLLRSMVRDVLRDVLPGLVEESTTARLAARPAAPAAEATAGGGREPVVLRTDADLDAFVRRIVTLAENPATRQRLTSGRLRFALAHAPAAGAPAATAATAAAPVRRVERGALTERVVRDAAAAGQSIVLARGVVLTPLARDRARALDVQITKES